MLLDVAAQLKRSAHAALGLVTNCAVYQLQANGRTGLLFGRLKTVTSQMAIPGAESAVYDCLVLKLAASYIATRKIGNTQYGRSLQNLA